MASVNTSQLQGRVNSHDERSKRKRTPSPAARSRNSEDSEAGERRPFDGSVSVSDHAHGNRNVAPNVNANANTGLHNIDPGIENRFANIEKLLTDHHELLTNQQELFANQQELLQNLVSAKETPPPPLPTPTEIYERARKEAEYVDFHHWDSLYIHGLVRVDGETSLSMTQDPPCGPCAAYNRVCKVLTGEDPYREFLCVQRNVCCGWCEYATIPSERSQQNWETPQVERLDNSDSSLLVNYENGLNDKRLGKEDAKKLITFFLDGQGIDREIISQKINRYLGNNARVRPGTYKKANSTEVISGFYVTAYRAPTDEMLSDIRAESALWQAEKEELPSKQQEVARNTQDQGSLAVTESTRPQNPYLDQPNYSYSPYGAPQGYSYGRLTSGISPSGYETARVGFPHDSVYNAPPLSAAPGPDAIQMYMSRPDRSPTLGEEPPSFPGRR